MFHIWYTLKTENYPRLAPSGLFGIRTFVQPENTSFNASSVVTHAMFFTKTVFLFSSARTIIPRKKLKDQCLGKQLLIRTVHIVPTKMSACYRSSIIDFIVQIHPTCVKSRKHIFYRLQEKVSLSNGVSSLHENSSKNNKTQHFHLPGVYYATGHRRLSAWNNQAHHKTTHSI